METMTLDTRIELTPAGRAAVHATPDYRPTIRAAYHRAANNGNSNACTVLKSLLPELGIDEDAEDFCPTCGSIEPEFCPC